MNIAEITNKVSKVSDIYASRFGIERDKDWYFLKFIEEVGELTKEYNKVSGRAKSKDFSQKDFEDEAADVLAHFLLFARANNLDLEATIRNKWFKYLGDDK